MHSGELYKSIGRLNPADIAVTGRLVERDSPYYNSGHLGSFRGHDVAIKPYEGRGEYHPDIGAAEPNALHILQGVPCVPVLHGALDGHTVLYTKNADLGRSITYSHGATVEELAKGQKLDDMDFGSVYGSSDLLAGYYKATGLNLRAIVASQIAGHFRKSLERGLFVDDFKPGDVFLQINPDGSVKVLRVDYGLARHTEEMPQHLDDLTRSLIRIIPEVSYGTNPQYVREKGIGKLADLLVYCQRGDFKQSGTNTFRQFLDVLEEGAAQNGDFMVQEGIKDLEARERYLQTLKDPQRDAYLARIEPELHWLRMFGITGLEPGQSIPEDTTPKAQQKPYRRSPSQEPYRAQTVGMGHSPQSPKSANTSGRTPQPIQRKSGSEALEEEIWDIGNSTPSPEEARRIRSQLYRLVDPKQSSVDVKSLRDDHIFRAAFQDALYKVSKAGSGAVINSLTIGAAEEAFIALREFERMERMGHEMSEAYAQAVIEEDPNTAHELRNAFASIRKRI